ncbi:MAG: Murein DD-endopeptidase MepM [Firmicutes bacterium]|nr:Murein DD-endopeptidase MepM [candidate division NPL-UPA2 bacterium]MBT9156589.1 Murein DD-endopeptidase MepM [candidate division NPL-UPA2 bacterium]
MQRRHRRKQIAICFALTLCALIFTLFWAFKAWEVRLDEVALGVVRDKQVIIGRLDARTQELQQESGGDVGLASQVEYRLRFTLARTTVDELWAELEPLVEFGMKASVINVNGQEVAALATREEAEAVLEALRSRFVKVDNNRAVESVRFRQDVSISEAYRKLDNIVDKSGGMNVMLFGRERRLTHTVARGESFWSIARLHNLRTSILAAANPAVVPERLRVGTALNLVVAEPFLQVEVLEKVTYNRPIPFQTIYVADNALWSWERRVRTPGRSGSQQITARVATVNGTEESREILSTAVLSSPTTQVVARGTKSAPTLSTGTFRWPTIGRITSPFGARWGGFHSGVDIGAPIGTPIVAADSGIVSFAGRNGGYGLMVRIEHGNGYATIYAHASRLLVAVNEQVEKGQTVALVGNTGRSFGPHLHFEIISAGRPLDPLRFFR